MPATTQTQNKLREPRSYGRVTKSEGPLIPQIADGTYLAQVADIQEGTSNYNGEEKEQFVIKLEILDDDYRKDNGDPLDLRAYISIPPTLLNDGVLNENSNLFKFMLALGYDMGSEIEVEPAQWQGERLLVEVTNKETTSQDGKKVTRPRITGYTRPPKGMLAGAAPAGKTAATGGFSRTAPARPASARPPARATAAPPKTKAPASTDDAPAPAESDDDNDF